MKITPEYLARSGTEDGEQSALFCHAREMEKIDYRWGLLYAIPNGGKRGVATAARMKATGTKRGFPDVGLPVPINRYPGLYIELKRLNSETTNAGIVNDDQKTWHRLLREQEYKVAVAYGWEAAATVIESYLRGTI